MHVFVYKEEPIEFCIQRGDKAQALRAIKMIFSKENALTHEIIYEERQSAYQHAQSEKSGDDDSVWRALTDPNLRGSTWMAIWVSVFNILSGVSIVTVYAIIIFEKLLNGGQFKGKAARLTSKQDSYFVGFASLTGAILSYYSIAIFSRRAIFIGGHFFMGVLLVMSGYYIHINQPELVLLTFCSFVVIYQASQGSCMFIYVAEIVVNEVAMGLSLFSLMLTMTIQSMFSTCLINSKMGLDVLFYILGLLQLVPFLYFALCLKETQGLSTQQKKKLYIVGNAETEQEPKKALKQGGKAK